MTVFNVSPVGQVNGTGALDAGFEYKVGQEVLAEFQKIYKLSEMINTIQLPKGTNRFKMPFLSGKKAEYYQAGSEVKGQQQVQRRDRYVNVDRPLIAHEVIDMQQLDFTNYDVRKAYIELEARSLAEDAETKAMCTLINAARVAPVGTPGGLGYFPGGQVLASATMATNIDTLVDAITNAAIVLDKKNVPKEDRYVYVTPDIWHKLTKVAVLNTTTQGGTANPTTGMVYTISGIAVVSTNFIPTGVRTAAVGDADPTSYAGDFTKTVAVVAHKMAVTKAIQWDVTTRIREDEQTGLSLSMVSHMAFGIGIGNPPCAVELAVL